MIKKLFVPIFTAGIGFSTYTLAMDASETQHSAKKTDSSKEHVYIGGRIGWSNYTSSCADNVQSCNQHVAGYGLYGGYQWSEWLALEGGVSSFGSPTANYPTANVSADVYGAELALKLSYLLSERWAVFTRLGGSWLQIDKNTSQLSTTTTSRRWNLVPSLGASYRLNQSWSLRGEYQQMFGIGDNSTTGQSDLGFASLGVTYHFGQAGSQDMPLSPETNVLLAPSSVVSVPSITLAPLTFEASSQFEFDSVDVHSPEDVDTFIEALRTYPKGAIYLIGHSDNVGTKAYNQVLSEKRAQSVAARLIAAGISPSRLVVIGVGFSVPVTSNDTPNGRAQNRRVEVRFETMQKNNQKPD